MCCYASVSVLLTSLTNGYRDGVQVALLELLLMTLFVAGVLYLFRRPARFSQTLAALAGSGGLLGLPALALIRVAGAEVVAPHLSTAWLLLLFWNLLINAHILRHALSSSLAMGAILSVLYVLASTQLILTGFPQLVAR